MVSRITSAGMALRYPPSTRSSPRSSTTGGSRPSVVMLARTRRQARPATCVDRRPRVRFVEQQKNGNHRSSTSSSPSVLRRIASSPLPLNTERIGRVRSASRCRGELSTPTSSLTRGSMCVVLAYLAYRAATSAPRLVPPTASTGTPASSNARSAPRCARPCPPPPVSTTPTARPATCRASRWTSASDERRSMWCRRTSARDARHCRV